MVVMGVFSARSQIWSPLHTLPIYNGCLRDTISITIVIVILITVLTQHLPGPERLSRLPKAHSKQVVE